MSARSEEVSDLTRAVTGLQTEHEIQAFLQDLCTAQEFQMLNERWQIARLVHMGFPYRIISQKTGASSATIARVSQCLSKGSGELVKACRRRQEAIKRQCVRV